MKSHARSKANSSNTSVSKLIQDIIDLGNEQSIVNLFRVGAMHESIAIEDRIPLNQELDTIVYEFQFRFGRADIVVFHIDGSATVIEVKNGTHGYNHVVAGIGQASLYAVQLATTGGSPKKVRKALLWTSTGDIMEDIAIEMACEQANTISLSWGKLSTHIQATKDMLKELSDKAKLSAKAQQE